MGCWIVVRHALSSVCIDMQSLALVLKIHIGMD